MKRAIGRSWLLVALFAFGCASESLVQDRSPASDAELAVSKIAVVSFAAAPRAASEPLRSDAAALVASYVSDAFAGRGIDTVPPSDVEQALGAQAVGAGAVKQAAEHFGAGAVAVGTVYRFRERSGEAMGSTQPASVGFEVRVFTADGRLFGAKVFDHTQVALSENALVARQYPGGGMRWLTAEELARWGASQLVQSFRLAPR